MEKVVLSFLGTDRPGIVASISRILLEKACNIEDVSMTTLQDEFAAIFIASIPENLQPEDLLHQLQRDLQSFGLEVLLKRLKPIDDATIPGSREPFVVTTMSADRLGLVAGIAEVMAHFGVNITNLKAVFRGGDDPKRNVMIYEVDVPVEIDPQSFRQALRKKADELELDLSLQHRDIFEKIHRL